MKKWPKKGAKPPAGSAKASEEPKVVVTDELLDEMAEEVNQELEDEEIELDFDEPDEGVDEEEASEEESPETEPEEEVVEEDASEEEPPVAEPPPPPPPQEPEQFPYIEFDSGHQTVVEAHNCVEQVLKERSGSIAKAFVSNVKRDKPGAVDVVMGVVVGGVVFFFTGDPTLMMASAPAGFFARNFRRLFRIRGSRDQIGDSDIPELSSFWNATCYMFVRFMRGFNARVDVIRALREDGVQLEVAEEWERRLQEARPQLLRARDKLLKLVPLSANPMFKDELEDRVRKLDPLGYGKGNVPMLEWLDMDSEKIRISLAEDQLMQDIVKMRDLRERYERMKESHSDVEKVLDDDAAVYEKFEEKFGNAVDATLEEDDKEE